MRLAWVFVLFGVTTVLAQESLKINQPVERQLASGSVQSYAIELKAGGYHSGAIPDGVTTETGWMARQFIASSKLPLRFYLDAGAFEFDSNGTGGGILETSRDMRDVLLAKGYEVHYQQFAGGHDYLSWRGTFADGLIDLIGTTNRISIPS